MKLKEMLEKIIYEDEPKKRKAAVKIILDKTRNISEGKSKEYKYHLGMIDDINVNEKDYKDITIENIQTSNLPQEEKKGLINLAQSIEPVYGQSKPISKIALRDALKMNKGGKLHQAKVPNARMAPTRPKATRGVYSKGGAYARRKMGRGSRLIYRTRA